MGQHLMSRPPKYVHGFVDRHGKPRFYFRRPGFKRMALPGLPWSPEFMSAYEAALGAARVEIGASRTVAGTVNAVVIGDSGIGRVPQPRTGVATTIPQHYGALPSRAW